MPRESPVQILRLPHTTRACQHASTIGGMLSLAWGVVIPYLIFGKDWSLKGVLAACGVLVPATALLVLGQVLRRRRAVWAAQGLLAIALAGVVCAATLVVVDWRARRIVVLVAACGAMLVPLGWRAWRAVGELRRAAGEERGFDLVPLEVPLATLAPPDATHDGAASDHRSDNDRSK
jgi:hypothetical protein